MSVFLSPVPLRLDFDWCWFLRRSGTSGEAVERILHDIGVMDYSGWADWQPSLLTNTGAPVAVTFHMDSDAVCITTEVDDPASPASGRFAKACDVITGLGGATPDKKLRKLVNKAQSQGPLTYGARLEITQQDRQCDTRLLVEIPTGATGLDALIQPQVRDAVAALNGAASLSMLAYDGKSGDVSLYGTIRNATRSHLLPLADSAGVSPDLLAMAIDGLTDTVAPGALLAPDLGFSFAATGPDAPPALTVYLAAQDMFGDDETILRRIMACGGHRLTGYVALIRQMHAACPGTTHHGQIGLTARRASMPLLSVSVAAPWLQHCAPE